MIVPKQIETVLAATKILIVDDEHYMRKVIRSLLLFVGVKKIHEACDGAAGLEAIGTRDARHRHPGLGNAAPERPGIRAGRPLAGDLRACPTFRSSC